AKRRADVRGGRRNAQLRVAEGRDRVALVAGPAQRFGGGGHVLPAAAGRNDATPGESARGHVVRGIDLREQFRQPADALSVERLVDHLLLRVVQYRLTTSDDDGDLVVTLLSRVPDVTPARLTNR